MDWPAEVHDRHDSPEPPPAQRLRSVQDRVRPVDRATDRGASNKIIPGLIALREHFGCSSKRGPEEYWVGGFYS
ncbi:hypothetical protein AB0D34_24275 [Streptomyces sp. NPDC048420]|uniref:hypothetical protein n=1 Tax=Streptomyces sp. NPDC048420 TaxID=3155755 RepID=UPI0034475F7B